VGAQPVPLGGEILVNTFTTGSQNTARVGMADDGALVVTWTSFGEDDEGEPQPGVFSRRYRPSGTSFVVQQVNTFTVGSQRGNDVDMNAGGEWVAAWQSVGQLSPTSGEDAFAAQRSGLGVGPEIEIDPVAAGDSAAMKVAQADDDSFVVAWGRDTSVFARRFGATGAPLTEVIFVATGADPSPPLDVGTAPNGAFVVVFQGDDGSSSGVFQRRFTAAGVALGGSSAVNAEAFGQQRAPAVGVRADGGYVIAWEDGNADRIEARRFDASGAPLGGDITISASVDGVDHERVDLAVARDGAFVAAWQTSSAVDAADTSIRALELDRSGVAIGGSFQVNTFPLGQQNSPSVGIGDGIWAVAWSSFGQASDGFDVFAQRYQRRVAAAGAFADGFESGGMGAWSAVAP
jgi:hypothetical protein